jgi:IS30 family transposase
LVRTAAVNLFNREEDIALARLKYKDRLRISEMYLSEKSAMEIAVSVGASLNTIYVELQRGDTGKLDKNQRREYSPELAQRRVQENVRRCGGKKQVIA